MDPSGDEKDLISRRYGLFIASSWKTRFNDPPLRIATLLLYISSCLGDTIFKCSSGVIIISGPKHQ